MSASHTLDERGGVVTTPDGTVRLEVPAGALAEPTRLTIRKRSAHDRPVALGEWERATEVEVLPDGLQLLEPAMLQIESAIPVDRVERRDVPVALILDEESGEAVPGEVLHDLSAGRVTSRGVLTHFSRYTETYMLMNLSMESPIFTDPVPVSDDFTGTAEFDKGQRRLLRIDEVAVTLDSTLDPVEGHAEGSRAYMSGQTDPLTASDEFTCVKPGFTRMEAAFSFRGAFSPVTQRPIEIPRQTMARGMHCHGDLYRQQGVGSLRSSPLEQTVAVNQSGHVAITATGRNGIRAGQQLFWVSVLTVPILSGPTDEAGQEMRQKRFSPGSYRTELPRSPAGASSRRRFGFRCREAGDGFVIFAWIPHNYLNQPSVTAMIHCEEPEDGGTPPVEEPH